MVGIESFKPMLSLTYVYIVTPDWHNYLHEESYVIERSYIGQNREYHETTGCNVMQHTFTAFVLESLMCAGVKFGMTRGFVGKWWK